MGTALTELLWAPLLAALGVLVGWWLRHWAEASIRRDSSTCATSSGSVTDDGVKSHADSLAGLSSRIAFVADLRRRIAEFERNSVPVSTLMIRVNNCDHLNGHLESRDWLATMSRLIRATVRDMDHIARLDDHTFGIMLPGTDHEEALGMARRIFHTVSQCRLPSQTGEHAILVSVAAAQVRSGDAANELLQRAEQELKNEATNRGAPSAQSTLVEID